MKKLRILLTIGFLTSAGVAQAATYYVAKTGSDGNPGTQTSPFLTLNRGASVLRPGDTLLVRGGTYAESFVNGVPSGTSWTSSVRIAAYPGEKVWMRPTSNYYVIHFYGNQQYIEFDGINLDSRAVHGGMRVEETSTAQPHHIRFQNAEVIGGPDGSVDGLQGPIAIILSASVEASLGHNEFRNLTIHGGGDVGDMYYGFYINSDANLIEGNNIYDVAGAAIQIYSSYGTSTNGNIVRNNILHDISRSMDTRTYGIILASGSGNQAYNNLVYNLSLAQAVGIRSYSDRNEIYNNTVYNVTGWGIQTQPEATNTIIRNNISYGNGINYLNAGSGTVVSNNSFDGSNPQFANASAGDFHLQATSGLKDAGISIGLVSVDYDGVPRPQGSAYDIGAFEFRDSTTAAKPPAPPANVHIVSR